MSDFNNLTPEQRAALQQQYMAQQQRRASQPAAFAPSPIAGSQFVPQQQQYNAQQYHQQQQQQQQAGRPSSVPPLQGQASFSYPSGPQSTPQTTFFNPSGASPYTGSGAPQQNAQFVGQSGQMMRPVAQQPMGAAPQQQWQQQQQQQQHQQQQQMVHPPRSGPSPHSLQQQSSSGMFNTAAFAPVQQQQPQQQFQPQQQQQQQQQFQPQQGFQPVSGTAFQQPQQNRMTSPPPSGGFQASPPPSGGFQASPPPSGGFQPSPPPSGGFGSNFNPGTSAPSFQPAPSSQGAAVPGRGAPSPAQYVVPGAAEVYQPSAQSGAVDPRLQAVATSNHPDIVALRNLLRTDREKAKQILEHKAQVIDKWKALSVELNGTKKTLIQRIEEARQENARLKQEYNTLVSSNAQEMAQLQQFEVASMKAALNEGFRLLANPQALGEEGASAEEARFRSDQVRQALDRLLVANGKPERNILNELSDLVARLSGYLSYAKGVASETSNPEFAAALLDAARAAAAVEQFRRVFENPSKDEVLALSGLVRQGLKQADEVCQKIVALVDEAEEKEEEQLQDDAERQLQEAASRIEAAAQQIAALKLAPKPVGLGASETVVADELLGGTEALTRLTAKLVHHATLAQQERRANEAAEAVEVEEKKALYRQNMVWAEGLISAAQATAYRISMLVGLASAVIQRSKTWDYLVAGSEEVQMAAVQLVTAARAKLPAMSVNNRNLSDTQAEVSSAVKALISTSKQFHDAVEPHTMQRKQSLSSVQVQKELHQHVGDLQAMEIQLEKERKELQAMLTEASGGRTEAVGGGPQAITPRSEIVKGQTYSSYVNANVDDSPPPSPAAASSAAALPPAPGSPVPPPLPSLPQFDPMHSELETPAILQSRPVPPGPAGRGRPATIPGGRGGAPNNGQPLLSPTSAGRGRGRGRGRRPSQGAATAVPFAGGRPVPPGPAKTVPANPAKGRPLPPGPAGGVSNVPAYTPQTTEEERAAALAREEARLEASINKKSPRSNFSVFGGGGAK